MSHGMKATYEEKNNMGKGIFTVYLCCREDN